MKDKKDNDISFEDEPEKMSEKDSKKEPKDKDNDDKVFTKGTVITFVVCAAIVISSRVLHPVRVIGNSMNPTYTNGNILASTLNDTNNDKDIDYYDVVVCDFQDDKKIDGRMIVKRVVGLPGDTIQVIDGILYRNGEAVIEEFEKILEPGIANEPFTLGDDEFFVIGDNRNNSDDSRFLGPVKEDEITNIITFRLLN